MIDLKLIKKYILDKIETKVLIAGQEGMVGKIST